MSVNITGVISEGLRRTVSRNGLMLIGILIVFALFNSLISIGARQTPILVALVSLVFGLVNIIVSIGAIRLFVSDETEELPREYFSDDIGWPLLNYIVGAIVFLIAVFIGTLLFVIPGIFLLVALTFWSVYVAAENESFITGFQKSWELTSGHRFNLFGLGIIVVILWGIIGGILGAIAGLVGGLLGAVIGLDPAQFGGALGSAASGPVGSIFALAALATAYNQLREQEDDASASSDNALESDVSSDTSADSV
ncbi:hypothetical protein [Halocatena marina]|uniref:hypothetical protein n=1 Tax=Halocatena marina TaxID=2934937 RepID=UPI00200C1263|nr:hypothetical protein [Halocatena marina]